MRHIPVPDLAKNLYPEAATQVISPPDGDLLNDECRAAEMQILPIEFMGREVPQFSAYFLMEPEDVDRLRQNGGVIRLSMIGGIPPFDVHPL